MFKHKTPEGAEVSASTANTPPPTIMSKTGQPTTAFESTSTKDVSLSALRDLMEKNLKWSQILYEQNRKINRKLFWASVASWIRTVLIIVPLTLAIIFLPSAYQKVKEQYAPMFQKLGVVQNSANANNLQEILKVLPIGDAERERLKNLLK